MKRDSVTGFSYLESIGALTPQVKVRAMQTAGSAGAMKILLHLSKDPRTARDLPRQADMLERSPSKMLWTLMRDDPILREKVASWNRRTVLSILINTFRADASLAVEIAEWFLKEKPGFLGHGYLAGELFEWGRCRGRMEPINICVKAGMTSATFNKYTARVFQRGLGSRDSKSEDHSQDVPIALLLLRHACDRAAENPKLKWPWLDDATNFI
ncbi:unnamed protein product, partial [Symbiodinium pilosum]